MDGRDPPDRRQLVDQTPPQVLYSDASENGRRAEKTVGREKGDCMNNLTKACKLLSLALTYAEDGAVITAIECGTEAMATLYVERDRRRKVGLISNSPGHGATDPIATDLANAAKKSVTKKRSKRA